MNQPASMIRRDTSHWIFMVWASFITSASLMAWGAFSLPAGSLDMAFVAMGVTFAVFSTMALSKFLRDNQHAQIDGDGWRVAVWAAFALSVTFTGWGLLRLECSQWQRGYLIACGLYLLSSSFTLAKTLRDKHDADAIERQGRA